MTDDLPICPDCRMPIDDVHDPCYESPEGEGLDQSIRQAIWEQAVTDGEAWALEAQDD